MTQLSLFDFIDRSQNNHPAIIQDLIDEVEAIFESVKHQFPPLDLKRYEYSIWDHVSNLGYRLFYCFKFDTPFINSTDKFCGIGTFKVDDLFQREVLIEKYKKKGIEISFLYSPTSFYITTIESKKVRNKTQQEEDE